MPNNIVLIAAVEADEAAKHAADEPLDARAKAAMRAVRGHWLATREEDQFAAACEGLARNCSPDELERVECELRANMALNALLTGVPVDLDAALADRESAEPIGLSQLWREVVAETAR